MDEEIKKYQDTIVDCALRAKKLQNDSGLIVGLAMEGKTDLIPVDAILKSLLKITTREDLKDRIFASQNPTN